MRSALRRRREPAPPSVNVAAAAAAFRAAQVEVLRAQYVDGLSDGVELVLNQLDPASRARSAGSEGCYDGPVPAALRDWIVWARANIDRERAERKGTAAS